MKTNEQDGAGDHLFFSMKRGFGTADMGINQSGVRSEEESFKRRGYVLPLLFSQQQVVLKQQQEEILEEE